MTCFALKPAASTPSSVDHHNRAVVESGRDRLLWAA